MATTNYSLPTILGTNAFDLVTDYNALANAIDAALAQVAGTIPEETITEMQGQISALQTLTGSQSTQITTLQSQMSTANGNITNLQSGLQTANSNIGALQTGQQEINTEIGNINTSFNDYSTFSSVFYESTEIHSAATSVSTIYVMKNVGETIVKIFGRLEISTSQQRTTVPGTTFTDGTPVYGIKTNIKVLNKTIGSGYIIQYAAVALSASSTISSPGYAIGNDGYLYVNISSNNTTATTAQTNFLQIPIYIGSPIKVVNNA